MYYIIKVGNEWKSKMREKSEKKAKKELTKGAGDGNMNKLPHGATISDSGRGSGAGKKFEKNC